MTRIILAVFLALFATLCRADITVTGRNGGPPLIYGTHYDIQQFADDSYFVRILQYYDTIPTNQYNIFIGDGDVIKLLQVSVPYSGGSGWNVSLDIDPESGATSGQLDAVTTPTQEPVQLNVFVRGNIGSLDATEIGTIRAQSGNVLGPITAVGSINGVVVNNGNILANITTGSGGSIGFVVALDGTIGTGANARVTVSAATRITSVIAREIYADIDLTAIPGVGTLEKLNATAGQFIGSIDAYNMYLASDNSLIGCVGDMEATITLEENLADWLIVTEGDFHENSVLSCNSLTDQGKVQITEVTDTAFGGHLFGTMDFGSSVDAGNDFQIDNGLCGLVRIGTDLLGDITIDGTPGQSDEGLTGQVIINANNSSGVWGAGATVVVGTTDPIVLTGDEYTATAASLGGGAVGLVPFSTHRESCSPVHGTVKTGTPTSITLQFYGPVKTTSIGMPVKVYRGDFGTGNNEVDVTSGFAVVMAPGGDRRKVSIVPNPTQFRPKYRYRLVPITTIPGIGETLLLCDDLLTANEVPVKGRDYWVDVDIALSMLDMGGNSWVDAPDLVLWANTPEDFNGDGNADTQDLQLIVDNLGTPVD